MADSENRVPVGVVDPRDTTPQEPHIAAAVAEPESTADEKPARLGFFVYVVESPSAPDIYHKRSEGELLAQAARLDSIPCEIRTAINLTAFTVAITLGLADAMKRYPDRFPILHISAHGSRQGIQLSSGDVLPWDDLRKLLLPINESLSGLLLLCMSACEGFAASAMAMQVDEDRHPFHAVIGHLDKPTWSDTAVAFASFYHLVAKGADINTAVAGMRGATNDQQWIVQWAEESRQAFAAAVEKLYLPAAQDALQTAAESAEVPPEAKALEDYSKST